MMTDPPCNDCEAVKFCSYIQVGRCELIIKWQAKKEGKDYEPKQYN
jgi:hypothetical protein